MDLGTYCCAGVLLALLRSLTQVLDGCLEKCLRDDTVLGSSVSNHHCRCLVTLKSSGIHYALLSTTDSVRTYVRTYMSVGSFMDAVCTSKLTVLYCCVLVHMCIAASLLVSCCCALVHIASVVTQHINSTNTRMMKNQPQQVVVSWIIHVIRQQSGSYITSDRCMMSCTR